MEKQLGKTFRVHLEQGQNLLAEVVVKIGVFRVAHIIDEDQSTALRLGALQSYVQLVNHALGHENQTGSSVTALRRHGHKGRWVTRSVDRQSRSVDPSAETALFLPFHDSSSCNKN